MFVVIHTCHFKHPGLKLGLPSFASSSVVKMCSTCCSLSCGALKGRSFSPYWTSGNLSKIRLSGAGILKMLLCVCCDQVAAGGPPAFCVMEAREWMSSLDISPCAWLDVNTSRAVGGAVWVNCGDCLFAASASGEGRNPEIQP